ncbi:CoA-acylating methylmalonate-semialdehyde dehydrogenase [Streptomyces sp. 7-21]|jgi:malonate-semialdehyde dehydrogenase (acetylating)/methylmalonate-semialdehyde dehydrogenase|uniref:CoA-acylating methylmalonate-semialdehyde dehydrogenase n=1 Tax=Streptomyces sp. 7-21 TaxID=2802283 RepID=UPI00191CB021|nr:CoA-acylating methylmalonate-semialdehyde dehydrogenase [Streptomyces sp. 7-21]MBL1066395.1 CoA-acylating methylmalonate-semialdehyde dehydrogenase [Streptomyces sp. 7-21]
MREIPHRIGGEPVAGQSGRYGPVFDPATGQRTGRVALASVAETDRAVAAARRAFAVWGASSLARRTAALFRFRELLHAHREELADLVTAEHGKVRADALGELDRGLEVVELACGVPSLLKGEVSVEAATGVDVVSLRQPLGVVACVTPFNFPAMVPLWTVPVALACGNTVVLKPSEKVPSAALRLAELAEAAGFPPGALNVLNGDRPAVERLVAHPEVAAVSFVGSTPVARAVRREAVARGKRVQALGGAKNHMVVLPDADLELAADAAVGAAYGSAGERCMAVSVVVAVGEAAGDALVERIARRAAAVRVGPGTDPRSRMGPLISAEHRERVAGYVRGARAQGARVVLDGTGLRVPGHEGGFFLGVSLLDRVRPGMDAYRDEIFGPVLCVVRAADYAEALALVNASPWGNGSAVFTRDGGAARRFQLEVEAGMVGVNVPVPVPVGYHSFGGWKDSLFGEHRIYGPDGVRFFTRGKVVTSRWPGPGPGRG